MKEAVDTKAVKGDVAKKAKEDARKVRDDVKKAEADVKKANADAKRTKTAETKARKLEGPKAAAGPSKRQKMAPTAGADEMTLGSSASRSQSMMAAQEQP